MNTKNGWKYCFDKKKKKIYQKTKEEDQLKDMYVYQLMYKKEKKGFASLIGYFSSYKKARQIMKKYSSELPGYKDHSHGFKIKKMELNRDNYYFYD